MPVRLTTSDTRFKSQFEQLLAAKREVSTDIGEAVAAIVDKVRIDGDAALVDYTNQFDRTQISCGQLRISSDDIVGAFDKIDEKTLAALELARDRIYSHHARQKPEDDRYTDAIGVELGTRWTAIQSVGLYVPGGTASYPSSVLMNAIPARVAGVGRLAMVVPTPDGIVNPLVLAAARLAGVDEIYRIGGAQAIAALAYGTATIPPVAKIVGPGNAWVTAAKKQVFGTVGIDMIAGPSEILVVADKNSNPDWIAIDLLAQAEHDQSAQSILITDDANFADQVATSLDQQLRTLPRASIAGASWRDFGAIIIVDRLENSVPLIDAIAPEHLEIATDNPDALLERITNAGAVFLGPHTPEAVGDYVAGSNHVLPTARSARFSSGLSVLDYMKRTSIIKCGPEQLSEIGPAAIALAEVEGLQAHGRSISMRINQRS
ncbi:MAG: histidinol dehydrogenase [Hyphomicrobiales bacterium]|nr:histidinol dehydrogenase [Hyphomicrobiales bacterium]